MIPTYYQLRCYSVIFMIEKGQDGGEAYMIKWPKESA